MGMPFDPFGTDPGSDEPATIYSFAVSTRPAP